MVATITLEQARHYLDNLDLSYIVDSMCSLRYPLPRWTEHDALYCCQLYKNFLFLMKKYPKQMLVPSREIDEFWHNHILYTENYFRDCVAIFGKYLHHKPASAEDDAQQLIDDYLNTKQLYFTEFGQSLRSLEERSESRVLSNTL